VNMAAKIAGLRREKNWSVRGREKIDDLPSNDTGLERKKKRKKHSGEKRKTA